VLVSALPRTQRRYTLWSLHSDNFNEHSKRIYLVTDSCSAEWQCLLCTVYTLACLLTYLLTYLLTL